MIRWFMPGSNSRHEDVVHQSRQVEIASLRFRNLCLSRVAFFVRAGEGSSLMTGAGFAGIANERREEEPMLGFRRSSTTSVGDQNAAMHSATSKETAPPIFEATSAMERVRLRWHSMDGGESCVPGQVQSIDGEIVEVWYDRNAPSFNPRHSDDHVWIDVPSGEDTLVFVGVLIGIRPPDTLVLLVYGLPRRDQRRQYVREHVDMPPQTALELDETGQPVGVSQEVFVVDLSGGGIRFEVDHPVAPQTRMQITLDVGTGPFEAVVRVIDTYQTMSGRHFARAAFLDIKERYRIEVIRFVFRQQLKKARLMAS